MARDYVKEIDQLIVRRQSSAGARRVADTFQIKVVKSLESTLSSAAWPPIRPAPGSRPIRLRAFGL